MALELGLGRAGRPIAKARSGANDLLLDARGQDAGGKKASGDIEIAADAMRKALDQLRNIGMYLTCCSELLVRSRGLIACNDVEFGNSLS
jgi:hypothetical protein